MKHYKPPRYRVLWRNLAGGLYAADRATLMTAWREAMSLHKSPVAWKDIRIHDTKVGVMWSLNSGSQEAKRWTNRRPAVSAVSPASSAERRNGYNTGGTGARDAIRGIGYRTPAHTMNKKRACRCCGTTKAVRDRAPKFKSSPLPPNLLCDGCWNDPSLDPTHCQHGGYVPTHERHDNA